LLRKDVQESHQAQYLDARKEILEQVEENEGVDIMQQMKRERNLWVTE